MKKYLFLLFLALLSISRSFGENHQTCCPMLWKVSKKGLAHDSFLFGTCHTGVHDYTIGELYDIFPRLKHIMKDVDCVMTETNHNLKDSLVIAECVKAAEIGMAAYLPNALNSMPDTISFESLYDDANMAKKVDQFLVEEYNVYNYKDRKPAFWWSRLRRFFYNDKFAPGKNVDDCIYEEALRLNKKYVVLETIYDQRKDVVNSDTLYLAYPLRKQANMLYDEILNIKNDSMRKDGRGFRLMLDSMYRLNNFCNIEQKLQGRGGMGENENLVVVRNKKWLPKIIKNITLNSCLVSFGFVHLGGETGLIELLRKEGYVLTPII